MAAGWVLGGLLGSFWARMVEERFVVVGWLWRDGARVLLGGGAVQLLAQASMAMRLRKLLELQKLLWKRRALQTRAEDSAVSSPVRTFDCRCCVLPSLHWIFAGDSLWWTGSRSVVVGFGGEGSRDDVSAGDSSGRHFVPS